MRCRIVVVVVVGYLVMYVKNAMLVDSFQPKNCPPLLQTHFKPKSGKKGNFHAIHSKMSLYSTDHEPIWWDEFVCLRVCVTVCYVSNLFR